MYSLYLCIVHTTFMNQASGGGNAYVHVKVFTMSLDAVISMSELFEVSTRMWFIVLFITCTGNK